MHIFNAAKNTSDIFQLKNFIRMTWIAKTHIGCHNLGLSQIRPGEGVFSVLKIFAHLHSLLNSGKKKKSKIFGPTGVSIPIILVQELGDIIVHIHLQA